MSLMKLGKRPSQLAKSCQQPAQNERFITSIGCSIEYCNLRVPPANNNESACRKLPVIMFGKGSYKIFLCRVLFKVPVIDTLAIKACSFWLLFDSEVTPNMYNVLISNLFEWWKASAFA